jgi:hypothetical protein
MNSFAERLRSTTVGLLASVVVMFAADHQCSAQSDFVTDIYINFINLSGREIAYGEVSVFPVGQPEVAVGVARRGIRDGGSTVYLRVPGIRYSTPYRVVFAGETVGGELVRGQYSYSIPPNDPMTTFELNSWCVRRKGRLVRKTVNIGQAVQNPERVIDLMPGDLLEIDFSFAVGFQIPIDDQGVTNERVAEVSSLGPRQILELEGLIGVAKEACFFRAKNRGHASVWVEIGDDTYTYRIRVDPRP